MALYYYYYWQQNAVTLGSVKKSEKWMENGGISKKEVASEAPPYISYSTISSLYRHTIV